MYISSNENDDEMNPPSYNIWTSGALQTPNIFKNILNPSGPYPESSSRDLYCLDSSSTSQKRKLLESEKDDFEERFHKVQRKLQLKKVAAKANLVVDDDYCSDEEDQIYQQMDWIEKNILSSESSDEDSLDEDQSNLPLLFLPRSKCKDERRKLLRISMAKIEGVDDPETYLRRSVLINNTVRRLQNDALKGYVIPPFSHFQGSATNEKSNMTEWDASSIYNGQADPDIFNFSYQYDYTEGRNDTDISKYPLNYDDTPSLRFHLALNSNKKSLETLEHKVLYSSPSVGDRYSMDEQRLLDIPLPSLVSKQPTPVHLFSNQPCSLQYRSPLLIEDSFDEYSESSSPSILNSVVYHSLIASLET